MPHFHIALLEPEIPGNTGNVGRLCVGIGAKLHLIEPLGFDVSEKAVRRAGIDHWKHVDLQVHPSLEAFLEWASSRRMHLFSAAGSSPYTRLEVQAGDVLLFGKESVGLPRALVDAEGAWQIPLPGAVRSLNLSNAVSVVAYHALRCVAPAQF